MLLSLKCQAPCPPCSSDQFRWEIACPHAAPLPQICLQYSVAPKSTAFFVCCRSSRLTNIFIISLLLRSPPTKSSLHSNHHTLFMNNTVTKPIFKTHCNMHRDIKWHCARSK